MHIQSYTNYYDFFFISNADPKPKNATGFRSKSIYQKYPRSSLERCFKKTVDHKDVFLAFFRPTRIFDSQRGGPGLHRRESRLERSKVSIGVGSDEHRQIWRRQKEGTSSNIDGHVLPYIEYRHNLHLPDILQQINLSGFGANWRGFPRFNGSAH